MFGQGVTGSNINVPKWIKEIILEIEKDYNFKLNNIYFKEPTRNKDYYGACYSVKKNHIELYFSRGKNDLRKWIVLHEMSHAIQHICYPETLTKTPSYKNNVNHNNYFWEISKKLFSKYNVLAIALQKEYKKGRKYLQII